MARSELGDDRLACPVGRHTTSAAYPPAASILTASACSRWYGRARGSGSRIHAAGIIREIPPFPAISADTRHGWALAGDGHDDRSSAATATVVRRFDRRQNAEIRLTPNDFDVRRAS